MKDPRGLICPSCRGRLSVEERALACPWCGTSFPVIGGIPVFVSDEAGRDIAFYEGCHADPHRAFNLEGIGVPIRRSPFVERNRRVCERVLNIPFKRERFFRSVVNRLGQGCADRSILDMGCGGGNAEIAGRGTVYGIDCCMTPLKHGSANRGYHLVVQGDATALPFESSMFDCVVSSDLIGHIPAERKERLFSEMARVMKPGAICGHVIETDADTFMHNLEKRHADLYRKYFVEGAGGHFGLERASAVVERFRNAGIEPLSIEKYFTYIRDMESFIALHDNEYRERSSLVNLLVSFYRLVCRNFAVKLTVTALMGFVSHLVDIVAPLDKAEGILFTGVKK